MNKFFEFEDFVTFKYSHIGEFIYNGKRGEEANSYALVMKKTAKSMKAGIIDADGREVVPCVYHDASTYYGKYYVQGKSWKEVDMDTGTVVEKQVFAKDFNYYSLRSVLRDAKERALNMEEYRRKHPEVTFDNLLYCSVLTINGQTISISADTKEELLKKKMDVLRKLSIVLSNNVTSLVNDVSEDLMSL